MTLLAQFTFESCPSLSTYKKIALKKVPLRVFVSISSLSSLVGKNNRIKSNSFPPDKMTVRQRFGQVAQEFLVNGDVHARENRRKRPQSSRDFATTELCSDLTHFSQN